jgi:glycine cleavage system regulatory protein
MEIATAKDFLNFVPVINLMLEERKMSNGEINTLRKELQTMNAKLDLLTEINQSIERGNYARKTNTTIDLNVEVSDKELIKRIQRQELMSVRRS